MSRKRIIGIAVAAVCGAVIGALAPTLRAHAPVVPALVSDKALLAHRPLLLAAAFVWVGFGFYWEIAARNAAPAKSSESRLSRSFHVFITNAGLLMVIAPIRGLGRFVPVSVALMSAGFVLEAAGLMLAIWARRHLGQNWSGEISIKVDHQLIRSGPYKWLRHPIYTGILAMYVGVVLVTGEWLALIGLGLVVLAYWRKIRLEETNLNVAFGSDYDAYRRESWALVPGVF